MILIAHRGESYIAPENALAAFKLAWETGAEACELDIHMSRDNRMMVMHDGKTGRTAGTDLIIKDTDSDELRKLDVGKFKGEQYAGEKIPFLEEALATMPANALFFVEIKCGTEALPVIEDVLDRSGKRGQVVLICFNLDVISASKKAMPDIPHYWLQMTRKDEAGNWLPYDEDRLIQSALDHGLEGLDLHYAMVTKEFADRARAAELGLYTWTVNDVPEAKRQRGLGIDGLTTDRCAWLKEQMG